MRICLVSQQLNFGRYDLNFDAVDEVIRNHVEDECDLFVFPEANVSGGFREDMALQDYFSIAEEVPGGYWCQRVIGLAQKYRTAICAGLIERDGADCYITHFLCDASGYIGKQRKLLPENPSKDREWGAGETMVPLSYGDLTCTVLACADFLYPEPAIIAGFMGSALLICPADCFAATDENLDIVATKLKGRAADTGAAVVAAFGCSADDTAEIIQVMACDAGGKTLVFETGSGSVTKAVTVELDVKKPETVWSGAKRRAQLLYKTDIYNVGVRNE